jgi:transglutaminase-like putative cysteine protease
MRTDPMRPILLFGLLAALAVFAAGVSLADTTALHKRKFEFQYSATIDPAAPAAGAAAQKIEVWIPYPQSDDHQVVSDVKVTAPGKVEIETDPASGNRIAHLVVEKPAQPVAIGLTFTAERAEYLHKDFPAGGGAALPGLPEKAASSPELARWLQPDRLVPLDDRIRKLSAEVTEGKTTPLDKERAIYDYVVKTMSYDKSGTGWGNGDIYWACDAKRGNCTDFHALFIGLSRAAGVPAKFEIGFPLPPEHGQAEVAGYHCWAEFYLAGYGWVPVDASEAKKHLEHKDYFFGALDENRVQLSVGRDLTLAPRQAGPPVNYFVYPYVEVDGKPYSGITKKFAFRDIG